MQELKPCPFCGSEPEKLTGMGEYWIKCPMCDASCAMTSSAESCIKAWNTRHQELKPLELNELSLMADEIRLGPKDEVTFKISQGTRLALNSRLQQFIENVCFRFGVKGG